MKIRTGLLVAAISALVVTTAYADGITNQATAQAPATNSQSATIKLPSGKHISRELAEKLTGDQIFQLLKDQNKDDIPARVPLLAAMAYAFVLAIISIGILARHRRNAMLHRTLATMIEKGVPIPPELLQSTERKRSDLRGGLVACGVGIGLMLFFWLFAGKHASGLWAVGFIPLFIGIARLIAWKLEQQKPNS